MSKVGRSIKLSYQGKASGPHILKVTLLLAKLLDQINTLSLLEPPLRNKYLLQLGLNTPGQTLRISADIQPGLFVNEQLHDLCSVLSHGILHISWAPLLPAERHHQLCENPCIQHRLQKVPVDEVILLAPTPKEEPTRSCQALSLQPGFPLFQEPKEWADPTAGGDHDESILK